MGWIVGASTNAGKAGSVQAINVSLGKDSPVVTFDRVEVITSLILLKLYLYTELIFVTINTNYICGENLGKCGKFWKILRNLGRFCHNLRAFMWRKIELKKYICGEK